MTLQKDPMGFGYEIYCDFCEYWRAVDDDDFFAVIEEVKAEGWKIFKDDDDWKHKCPDCARNSGPVQEEDITDLSSMLEDVNE